MSIVPINPVQAMGSALIDGIGISVKPETPEEIQTAFIELLLDRVFLKSFMSSNEDKGIFAAEEDNVFGRDQNVGMYRDLVRKEMIHQLAADEQFGFAELFANVPSLPK